MKTAKATADRFDRAATVIVASIALVAIFAPAAYATNGYLIHGIGTRAKALAGKSYKKPLPWMIMSLANRLHQRIRRDCGASADL